MGYAIIKENKPMEPKGGTSMSTKHYITYKRYERDRGIGEYKGDHKPPPQWLLDKIADEKLSGGFVLKNKNLCPNCNEFRSVNGTCGCD